MLYDITMELFNRLSYRMYASDMAMIRTSFFHSFNGRPFTFAEVKFFESIDCFVVTELVFKMFHLHNISNLEDATILAKHNVPRLVGLYQSLVCKVNKLVYFISIPFQCFCCFCWEFTIYWYYSSELKFLTLANISDSQITVYVQMTFQTLRWDISFEAES